MRELHWHATAAEWAFVIEGRVRTTVIDPQGIRRDERLRAGRRLVLPARPRPHARMPGRRAVPLHPDLRQRLLLRVRHVQHHRLDRPHPQGAAGEELRPARIGLRRLPEGRGLLRPRAQCRPRSRPTPLAGLEAAAADAQVSAPRPAAASSSTRGAGSGGSIPRSFPISKTITGAILDLDPGALRELHWHPTADEWQYVIEGKVSVTMFGSHGRYRTETLEKGDVGYIPQGYGHSIENVGDKPCRVLIGFNTGDLRGRSTCRSGSPATRPTCWPPTSASRRPCSRSSRARTCSSRTRTGPRSPRRNGLEAKRRARACAANPARPAGRCLRTGMHE